MYFMHAVRRVEKRLGRDALLLHTTSKKLEALKTRETYYCASSPAAGSEYSSNVMLSSGNFILKL